MELTEITTYPLKSAEGIKLTETEILDRGLAWDRHLALFDMEGNVITARTHPKLLALRPSILNNQIEIEDKNNASHLRLILPQNGQPLINVAIFGNYVTGNHLGQEADDWFSNYLEN